MSRFERVIWFFPTSSARAENGSDPGDPLESCFSVHPRINHVQFMICVTYPVSGLEPHIVSKDPKQFPMNRDMNMNRWIIAPRKKRLP